MKRRPGLRLLLASWIGAAAVAGVAGRGAAGEGSGLAVPLARNQFLEAELGLARQKGFYLVFDLERREVLLKARGVAFRSWAVSGYRLWGGGVGAQPLALEDRQALLAPRRESVEPTAPGGAGGAPKPTPALEVTDMPDRYALRLSGGVTVAVVPVVTGVLPRFGAAFPWLWRRITLPLVGFWHHLRGHPFATLEIALAPADARALYWAFREGMRGLIFVGSGPAEPLPAGLRAGG